MSGIPEGSDAALRTAPQPPLIPPWPRALARFLFLAPRTGAAFPVGGRKLGSFRVWSSTDVYPSTAGPRHPSGLMPGPLVSCQSAAHQLFLELTHITCWVCNRVNKWHTASDCMCIRPVVSELCQSEDVDGCVCVGGWLCCGGVTPQVCAPRVNISWMCFLHHQCEDSRKYHRSPGNMWLQSWD